MESLDHLAELLLSRLAWTSLQAVLLIGAVALITRLLPRLPAALRCMLWWLVGLQLVLGLCWHAPLELPLLAPTNAVSLGALHASERITTTAAGLTAEASPAALPAPSAMMPTPHANGWIPAHWRLLLATLWLACLLVQGALAWRQWRQVQRVLRGSTRLPDALMQAAFARRARALGLRRCPRLRVSHVIDSPQVSGLWRPVVLVPSSHALTSSELSMALAHELAHLRRGDLWLGWVPAIAQRLFFFHPLVAWAVREYALHREAACDAQVLQQTDAPPHAYGDLLLRLGVAHPMHSGLAGASPTFQNLKRRLTMLQQTDSLQRPQLRGWLLIALIALAGVLPWRVTAAHADNANVSAQATHVPPPPPPLPPPPPAPPVPPMPPRDASGFSARHVDIDTTWNARNGFALIDGDSVTINGSEADLDTVKQLRKSHPTMLWFRRGDKAYVIHDPAYLQRAKAIYAPVTALAKQQGVLGGQQGQLGGKQGALGARQGALGSQQAQLAGQQAQLAGEQARASQHGSAAALDARQAQLESAMDALGRQQEALGQQQEALGKQQEALGAKQEALGQRQQQATEQADHQIETLLDEALAKGAAEPAGR